MAEATVPETMLKKLPEPIANSDEEGQHLTKREQELVRRYRKKEALAPSEINWKLLVHLGLITNFRRFLLEAERKLSECRRGEVDLEDAKPMFEMMAGGIGDVNEGYLAHLCTMSCAITYCVRLLGTTVFEGFSWAGGEILDIPLTRTDVSIVYNKQGFPRLISVVIKVQRSVQADLTRVSEDNLAQLFYEGHLVFKRQRVTPLLVLTDCGVWHFFEMDLSTSPPTVVKYYCADCGILKGTAAVDTASCLSMTPTSYFDAAPVFTEIIAFNEEFHKQQQAKDF